MSLDKAIASGKEHRRGYRQRGKPGEFDKTCRPHGGGTSIPCPWCQRARLLPRLRVAEHARDALAEFHQCDQGDSLSPAEPIAG